MEIKIKIRFKEKGFFRTKEVQRHIGFRFDMLSWWKLCDVNSMELGGLAEMDRGDLVRQMVYAAHYSYCIEQKTIIEYTEDECKAWFDQFTLIDGENFANGMMQSQIHGKTVQEHGEQVEKK